MCLHEKLEKTADGINGSGQYVCSDDKCGEEFVLEPNE